MRREQKSVSNTACMTPIVFAAGAGPILSRSVETARDDECQPAGDRGGNRPKTMARVPFEDQRQEHHAPADEDRRRVEIRHRRPPAQIHPEQEPDGMHNKDCPDEPKMAGCKILRPKQQPAQCQDKANYIDGHRDGRRVPCIEPAFGIDLGRRVIRIRLVRDRVKRRGHAFAIRGQLGVELGVIALIVISEQLAIRR